MAGKLEEWNSICGPGFSEEKESEGGSVGSCRNYVEGEVSDKIREVVAEIFAKGSSLERNISVFFLMA